MAEYTSDSMPDDYFMSQLSSAKTDVQRKAALDALNAAVEADMVLGFDARMATVYNRKGYMSYDEVGGTKNPSYSSETDDLIIQVTVRVDYSDFKHIDSFLARVNDYKQEAAAEKVAELERLLAVQEEAEKKAKLVADNTRDALAKLKGEGV